MTAGPTVGAPANPRFIAGRLRAAYETDLGEVAAFLPSRVPLDDLPVVFKPYLAAAAELAPRYQAGAGGVRSWLGREFAHEDPAVHREVAHLGTAERETLMTVLSALGHAYRWDELPPANERFDEVRITLPTGIDAPWRELARVEGVPRVGTTWTFHLCNWKMNDRPGGARYRTDELSSETVRVARNWLLPPLDIYLDRFSVSFVLLEARGAPILACLVAAVEGAARRQCEEVAEALDRLAKAIEAMTRFFSTAVRQGTIHPKIWLTLVQPTFAWSAEADVPGAIEGGASGLQVGVVQALDAVLGIWGSSTLARAALDGRRLMPPRHRRFLAAADAAGPVLRDFVLDTRSACLTDAYNRCVRRVQSFRSTHHARAKMYLANRPEDGTRRVSTGLTIRAEDDPLSLFDSTTCERAAETEGALITNDPARSL